MDPITRPGWSASSIREGDLVLIDSKLCIVVVGSILIKEQWFISVVGFINNGTVDTFILYNIDTTLTHRVGYCQNIAAMYSDWTSFRKLILSETNYDFQKLSSFHESVG